jgi:archaemetzincin
VELQKDLKLEVRILPCRDLPATAWYPPRQRYRAEALLADLDRTPSPDKVLGLTRSDISTPLHGAPDWGIFGLGTVGGHACVVSLHRLGRGPRGADFLEARLHKVALHELGHTFGLVHCSVPGCVMGDAEGRLDTVDRSGAAFCPACRRLLDVRLAAEAHRRIPSPASP